MPMDVEDNNSFSDKAALAIEVGCTLGHQAVDREEDFLEQWQVSWFILIPQGH